jgi:cyclase
MHDFEQEKAFLLQTVNNDPTVYADAELRLPDIVFGDYLRLDLGGRVVELYHFGPGNTPGDTVVYVPEARVAWTGNLVVGEGSIPFLIEGGAQAYLGTIAQFAQALEVETIVPGHGTMTSGRIFDRYLGYLSNLIRSVREATRAGRSLDQTLQTPLAAAYAPPPDSPLGGFVRGVHGWNLRRTYQELNGR